jgi:hypothetical protein
VNIQPINEIGPNAASEAGNKNIPEPIMLPITRAVQAIKPSLPLVAVFVLSTFPFIDSEPVSVDGESTTQ